MKAFFRKTILTAVSAASVSFGQQPASISPAPGTGTIVSAESSPTYFSTLERSCASRKPFESDHEFDGFVGPISNPVFSKDPRSNTECGLCLSTTGFQTDTGCLRPAETIKWSQRRSASL